MHLNLSWIADALWFATDELENANLHEIIWLDFHPIKIRFFIRTFEKKIRIKAIKEM